MSIYETMFGMTTGEMKGYAQRLTDEQAAATLQEVYDVIAQGKRRHFDHLEQWPNSAGLDIPIGRQAAVKEALEDRLERQHLSCGLKDGQWVWS